MLAEEKFTNSVQFLRDKASHFQLTFSMWIQGGQFQLCFLCATVFPVSLPCTVAWPSKDNLLVFLVIFITLSASGCKVF